MLFIGIIILAFVLLIGLVLNSFEKPCLFHKWSEVIDNKQTCKNCGKVINHTCSHIWEEVDVSYLGATKDINGRIAAYTGRIFRIKCKKCGEISSRKV